MMPSLSTVYKVTFMFKLIETVFQSWVYGQVQYHRSTTWIVRSIDENDERFWGFSQTSKCFSVVPVISNYSERRA